MKSCLHLVPIQGNTNLFQQQLKNHVRSLLSERFPLAMGVWNPIVEGGTCWMGSGWHFILNIVNLPARFSRNLRGPTPPNATVFSQKVTIFFFWRDHGPMVVFTSDFCLVGYFLGETLQWGGGPLTFS